MKFRSGVLAISCLVAGFFVAGGARAQLLLSPRPGPDGGNGAQIQAGVDFPFPAGEGIFLGGMTWINGGTMGGGTMTGLPPDGPGRPYWPPLLLRRNPVTMGTIMAGLSTPMGGAITVPPGVLVNPVGVAPRAPVGVQPGNFLHFQLRTSIDYEWPAATAVFAPGGGPGLSTTPVILSGPGGGTITYNAGSKSFGGAAAFSLTPGPFAGTGKVPPGGTMGSRIPVVTLWFNAFNKAAASATRALLLGASGPIGTAGPGQTGAAPSATTMFGPVPLAIRQLTGVLPILGPSGTVPLSMSFGLASAPLINPVTGSRGFPWTTGLITATAPGNPPDLFFLSGRDTRVNGMGNVSMVSGALSLRKLSLANANRGWVTLTMPEPAGAFGVVAALGVLGICHALMRRR